MAQTVWHRGRRATPRQLFISALVVVVALLGVLGLVRLKTDTTVASFLPAGDPAVASLHEAARAFGGDPIVVMAESDKPRALLGPDQLPRLLHLESTLAKLPDVAVVYGPASVLNQIAGTAKKVIGQITVGRDAIRQQAQQQAEARGASPADVAAAVAQATTEFDERYAALLVKGLPAGLPTLRNPDFITTVVFGQSDQPKAEWRYVIPAPNAVAVLVRPREDLDEAGTQHLVENVRAAASSAELATSRLTVSGSPAVASELGATVKREIPLIGTVALVLIGGCYLLMPWLRRRRYRLLPIMATLGSTVLTLSVFGWIGRPLSLGVITFLPIMIGIGSDFPAYLMHGGISRRRVVVVAAASAAGFAALALSPLPFVRDLGLALAVGVFLAVGLAFGLRALFGVTPEEIDEPAPSADPWSIRTRLAVLGVAVLVSAGGWVLLPHVPVEAQPEKLAAGLPTVAEAQHTEDVLGSSGEVEVVLRGNDLRTPPALAWMRQAQNVIAIDHGGQLHPIVSLPDLVRFLGDAPTPEQVKAALDLLPHYLVAAVLSDDGKQSVISLGMSLQDLGQQRTLLQSLRTSLPPPLPGMTVDVVGLPVAAARGFELVSQGRYLTNCVGILAAGLVLLIGLRRRDMAGRALLAAALATGWGFAGSWLLGLSLSPLSVALGSLTTATACEFTALLSYAKRSRTDGLQATVRVAAVAAALGYLALVVSKLVVIRDFGLLLAGTVALSLLAAHLVVRVWPPKAAAWQVEPAAVGDLETLTHSHNE
jgi:predicted RND superfamily exporter protein